MPAENLSKEVIPQGLFTRADQQQKKMGKKSTLKNFKLF